MKKLLSLTMILCMMCMPALAEAAEPARIDLTNVLVCAVWLGMAVLGALIAYAWKRWIKPWLKKRDLLELATMVVAAVEAYVGRGNGTKKWQMALEKMEAYGFDIDSEVVIDALKAAWKQLDLTQIMAGEKEKPPEDQAQQPEDTETKAEEL